MLRLENFASRYGSPDPWSRKYSASEINASDVTCFEQNRQACARGFDTWLRARRLLDHCFRQSAAATPIPARLTSVCEHPL